MTDFVFVPVLAHEGEHTLLFSLPPQELALLFLSDLLVSVRVCD